MSNVKVMLKNKIFFIFVSLVTCFVTNTFSQITIGSNLKANSGALLDLKQNESISTKGLLLPRVSLKNINELTMGDNAIQDEDAEWMKSTGLMVYNVDSVELKDNRLCPGLHIWSGDTWFSLKPYDDILERTLEVSLIRNYEYLVSDPNDPQFDASLWPVDKRQDAKDGKYMLGHTLTNNTENLEDVRGDESFTYNVSRFYVGYKTEYTTYEVQKSFNCDSSAEPIWVADHRYKQMNKIFDDGVWTTQNVRTAKFPDGTDIPLANPDGKFQKSDILPYYVEPNVSTNLEAYGRFYNWAAVINMGTGVGQTPIPVGEQGGNMHDVKIQGICPDGWHVPSMQELTDMYNGLSLNAPSFSGEPIGGGSDVFAYVIPGSDDAYQNGIIWNALRASSMGYDGNSYLPTEGGFYCLPSGRPNPMAKINAYYWTASSATPSSDLRAYGTYMATTDNKGVKRDKSSRADYQSVRCMRNNK